MICTTIDSIIGLFDDTCGKNDDGIMVCALNEENDCCKHSIIPQQIGNIMLPTIYGIYWLWIVSRDTHDLTIARKDRVFAARVNLSEWKTLDTIRRIRRVSASR